MHIYIYIYIYIYLGTYYVIFNTSHNYRIIFFSVSSTFKFFTFPCYIFLITQLIRIHDLSGKL